MRTVANGCEQENNDRRTQLYPQTPKLNENPSLRIREKRFFQVLSPARPNAASNLPLPLDGGDLLCDQGGRGGSGPRSVFFLRRILDVSRGFQGVLGLFVCFFFGGGGS